MSSSGRGHALPVPQDQLSAVPGQLAVVDRAVEFGVLAATGTLIKSNIECKSDDEEIRDAASLEQCARAVATRGGEFFIYRKLDGQCYWQRTASLNCREGWEEAADVVDAEDRVDVAALGYAGTASESATFPAPLEDTGLPAPRERMGELDRFYQALLVRNAGRLSAAIEQLAELVEENPRNNLAVGALGGFLVEAQRYDEAVEHLEALLRAGHERTKVLVSLAKAHAGLGDVERARLLLRRALELVPGDGEAREELDRLGE